MTPRTKREHLRELVAETHRWSKVRFPSTTCAIHRSSRDAASRKGDWPMFRT